MPLLHLSDTTLSTLDDFLINLGRNYIEPLSNSIAHYLLPSSSSSTMTGAKHKQGYLHHSHHHRTDFTDDADKDDSPPPEGAEGDDPPEKDKDEKPDLSLFPWYEDPNSSTTKYAPASRGTYHGQNGNMLKVVFPGHTDLVWSTNFNDEWAEHLVCKRHGMWAMNGVVGKNILQMTHGLHPEFIFSKPIKQVTVQIYEGTKFSFMDPGDDHPFWKKGVVGEEGGTIPPGEDAKEYNLSPMTKRRRLWRATFNLMGGNHIMPNQPAPPMWKMCDAPAHRVWEGDNIGKWNELHTEPSLVSYFDIKLDGTTAPEGNSFHEDMRVMLDRRVSHTDIFDYIPADTEAKKQQNLYGKRGPARWAAQAGNLVIGAKGAAKNMRQNLAA